MALLMPAVPISYWVQDLPADGIILRFMAPQRGVVKGVLLDIDKIDPAVSDLRVTMHGEQDGRTVENTFPAPNGHLEVPVNAAVLKGTKIVVSLDRANGEPITSGQVQGIWLSADYIPDIKDNITVIKDDE